MTSRNDAWPQPHEDVHGIDLVKGDLLALDDDSIARRLDLLAGTWQRWDDILHGRINDRDTLFERMYNPRVGDLVVEYTTSFRKDVTSQVQASGVLLVHKRREWTCTDEEWAQVVALEKAEHEASGLSFDAEEFAQNDRAIDIYSYVQYGAAPNDICRWGNCQLIAIPEDIVQSFSGVRT